MAFSLSGIFLPAWVALADGTIGYGAAAQGLDFDAASMFKAALYDNTVSVAADTVYEDTMEKTRYNGTAAYFASTGGATGSTQVYCAEWAQGGLALSGAGLTKVGSGGLLMFDASDRATTASTATMSGIRGVYVYADGVAVTSNVDPGLCAITFGADYAVTNGSFTIQWNASGLFRIDMA